MDFDLKDRLCDDFVMHGPMNTLVSRPNSL
jgi:hypothetical protein